MARRTFSPEFKAEATALVLEHGLSVSQVARDLGVGQPTISRWVLREGDVVARYPFIFMEEAIGDGPVVVMCRALNASKSAFYPWCANPARGGASDRLLRVHIRAIHRESRETYGSPRILVELRE